MEAFISTFHIDLGIIIAQAINFIIVVVVMYVLALKPIKKLMQEREDKISKGLEDAKTHAGLLLIAQKEQEDIINRARNEAHDIFEAVKKEALDNKQSMMEKTDIEIATMIDNGKKILEAEKASILEEAKKEIVMLVVRATEKLLETHKDKDYDEKSLKQIKEV